jgi:hypothetical protein
MNYFKKLECNKPASIPLLEDGVIKLQLLQSLCNDRDWSLFVIAKGAVIRVLSTTALLNEARTFAGYRNDFNYNGSSTYIIMPYIYT